MLMAGLEEIFDNKESYALSPPPSNQMKPAS